MTTPTDPFTKDLKVGDIITGYRKGYWKVTSVRRRYLTQDEVDRSSAYGPNAKAGDQFNALIGMKQVADTNGKPKNGKREYFCDVAFCRPVSVEGVMAEYENTVRMAEDRRDMLLTILGVSV